MHSDLTHINVCLLRHCLPFKYLMLGILIVWLRDFHTSCQVESVTLSVQNATVILKRTMHKGGHWGLTLLCYAPIVFAVLSLTKSSLPLAFAGIALASGLCMLPDIDQRIPMVSHRGLTHTIWFALIVGGILGGGAFIISRYVVRFSTTYVAPTIEFTGLFAPINLGWFFGITGIIIILSHLLGDWLTVMGIRPYAPLWHRKHKLGIVKADNWWVNKGLYGLGAGAIIVSLLAGMGIIQLI